MAHSEYYCKSCKHSWHGNGEATCPKCGEIEDIFTDCDEDYRNFDKDAFQEDEEIDYPDDWAGE